MAAARPDNTPAILVRLAAVVFLIMAVAVAHVVADKVAALPSSDGVPDVVLPERAGERRP